MFLSIEEEFFFFISFFYIWISNFTAHRCALVKRFCRKWIM